MINLPPYILPDLEICRVDFDLADFQRSLLQHGRRIWWEGAQECPCRRILTVVGVTQQTGEPLSDCTACQGAGILMDSGQQTIGMFTGIRESQKRYNEFGPNAAGYGYISLLPENLPNINDRFTLIDGWRIHSEIKRRGSGSTDSLRYPITPRTFRIGAGTNYAIPKTITVGVLHGAIAPTTLVEGTHFVVNASGQIDWTLGDGLDLSPAEGSTYSVRYICRPVFVCVDHVFVSRDLHNRTSEDELALGQHPVNITVMAEHLAIRSPPVAAINPTATWEMPG